MFNFVLLFQLYEGKYSFYNDRTITVNPISGVYADTTGMTYRSTTNVMSVVFTSDKENEEKGFRAMYTQGS